MKYLLHIIGVCTIASGVLFVLVDHAFAQTFVSLTTGQQVNGTSPVPMLSTFFSNGTASLPDFFNAIFKTAISVGAILAVLRLAYAGWKYMSSDAFGQKSDAKDIIRDAIIGLLLLLGIYIILFQINPCLLNLDVLQSISGTQSTCSANQQYNPGPGSSSAS